MVFSHNLSQVVILKMWWLSIKYELFSISSFHLAHNVLYFSQSREQTLHEHAFSLQQKFIVKK